MRPVSTRAAASGRGRSFKSGSTAAEKYAGGGGILILEDQRPQEPADYLVFETQTQQREGPELVASTDSEETTWHNNHLDLDPNAPEADPPQAFEVCPNNFIVTICPDLCFDSILLTTIRLRKSG